MLMLLTVAVVIVVALARGGSLNNFSSIRLRWVWLVALSLALQLLIFTPFRSEPIIAFATPWLYVLSMLIAAVWVGLNWRVPGMAIMAAGLLCNTLAIAANGGYMPVSPDSARYAGSIEHFQTDGPAISNNSIATDENVRLWLLTDILALPKEVPLANVFSIGDVLLTLGAAWLCYRTIRRPPLAGQPLQHAPARPNARLADEG